MQTTAVFTFIREAVSRAGFDGFAKPVSDLQRECMKPPKPVLVRFRQIEYALGLRQMSAFCPCI